LVIPKKEVDYIFDLEDQTYQDLMMFAKRLSTQIKAAFPCDRIGVAVVGLEVPHVHIHLIPINTMDDMNFARPKLRLSADEFVQIAERIKNVAL
jgi:histidine triad (HIT) family protein